MLYVTGDVHADLRDLESRPFGRLKKEDYVVICGDFGMVWDGSPEERRALTKLGKSRNKVLFLDGSHENFDLLGRYPVTEWNGGNVQVISGNLMHLMRGQVYEIDGRKIFTFGGGESDDREMRVPGKSWWPQEVPTEKEMQNGIENLVANSWRVDYLFTYQAPSNVHRLLTQDEKAIGTFQVYLDHIREQCSYDHWILGNYHCNKRISTSMDVVFDDVICLATESDLPHRGKWRKSRRGA